MKTTKLVSSLLDGINWDQTIGFGSVFDKLMLDHPMLSSPVSYPPYNISIKDDLYTIEIAAAGFSQDELKVTLEDKNLVVSGSKQDKQEDTKYLHRSLSTRSFKRSFALANDIEVKDVSYDAGILRIDLLAKTVKPEVVELPINGKLLK